LKTVLVTGSAGFIGSFLTDELLSRGYRVVGVDNLFRGRLENLETARRSPSFEFVKLDLATADAPPALHKLLKTNNAVAVFHLAAINGTQYFYDASGMVLDVNVRATQTVVQAVEGSAVDTLFYTSSSEVYGEPMQVPTPETHPILLNSQADRDSYAASKALGDFYIRFAAQKLGIRHLNLRIFNQYGPRMVGTKYGQVIGEFISRALTSEPFTIIGDGSHTRSFCFVRDAARLIVDLYERGARGQMNLGRDEEITILELARRVHAQLGKPCSPVFLPERPHDHRRRCPDLTLLRRALPNATFTSLDDGLAATIAHFRGQAAAASPAAQAAGAAAAP
jgi:nucleoside-diphosphate-sugar epimerase